MTAEQFAYWLQGFTELTSGQTPSPAQWKSIREHLDLVFKKVTPPLNETTVKIEVDAKDAVKSVDSLTEAMRKYFEAQKQGISMQPVDWTKMVVTC